MHAAYEDIRSRIAEEPTWWDMDGVPRYGEFHPDMCPNIYSNHVVLLLIACQYCGQRFHVEMHAGYWQEQALDLKAIHYGDPPRHSCDGGGDTMNCDDIAVVQSWHRTWPAEWARCAEEERVIE